MITSTTSEVRDRISAFLAGRGGFDAANATLRQEWDNGSAAEQVRWPSAKYPEVLVIVDSYDGRKPFVWVETHSYDGHEPARHFTTSADAPDLLKRLGAVLDELGC